MSSNKIKKAVENLKATYNTNNPFVICEHLGITVRERNFNETRKAYFVSIYGQPSITINSNYIEKSKNILCAHELGHIILGHTGVNNFESENQEAEREANLFAASLLISDDMLQDYSCCTQDQFCPCTGYPKELIELRLK